MRKVTRDRGVRDRKGERMMLLQVKLSLQYWCALKPFIVISLVWASSALIPQYVVHRVYAEFPFLGCHMDEKTYRRVTK